METTNKLEEQHLEAIEQSKHWVEGLFSTYWGIEEKVAACKSAEITQQIAVEFADFYVSYCNKHGQTHSEEVFEEFLKTKQ